MSDPLLEKAKLLIMAANMTIGGSSNTSSPTKDNLIIRSIKESDQTESFVETNTTNSNFASLPLPEGQFRGAVITGSSMLTTYSDIRNYCEQGGTIIVDGQTCTIKQYGEWSATNIEFNHDFLGNMNLNAIIVLPKFKDKKIRNNIKSKNGQQPVPSNNIQKAIESLNDVNSYVQNSRVNQNSERKSSSRNNVQIQSKIKGSSPTKAIEDDYERKVPRFSTDNAKVSSSSKGLVVPSYTSSEEADDRLTQELHRTQERIAEWKKKMEAKILEEKLEEEKLSRRHRRKQEIERLGDSLSSSAKNSLMNVHKTQENSIEAEERERLKREESLRQAELKAVANEMKIAKLREKTQLRVAEYKDKLAREEWEEKDRQEAEEIQRKQSELRAQSASRQKRLLDLKRETSERLRQRNDEQFAKQQEEAELIEWKLKELSRMRGRQDPTSKWYNRNNEPPHDESTTCSSIAPSSSHAHHHVHNQRIDIGYQEQPEPSSSTRKTKAKKMGLFSQDDLMNSSGSKSNVPPMGNIKMSGAGANNVGLLLPLPPLRTKSANEVKKKHAAGDVQDRLSNNIRVEHDNLAHSHNNNAMMQGQSQAPVNSYYSTGGNRGANANGSAGVQIKAKSGSNKNNNVDNDEWSDDSLGDDDPDFWDPEEAIQQQKKKEKKDSKPMNSNNAKCNIRSVNSHTTGASSGSYSYSNSMEDSSTVLSDVTPDGSPIPLGRGRRGKEGQASTVSGAGSQGQGQEKELLNKKRKKKKTAPVWRMEPIALQPFQHIPTAS